MIQPRRHWVPMRFPAESPCPPPPPFQDGSLQMEKQSSCASAELYGVPVSAFQSEEVKPVVRDYMPSLEATSSLQARSSLDLCKKEVDVRTRLDDPALFGGTLRVTEGSTCGLFKEGRTCNTRTCLQALSVQRMLCQSDDC